MMAKATKTKTMMRSVNFDALSKDGDDYPAVLERYTGDWVLSCGCQNFKLVDACEMKPSVTDAIAAYVGGGYVDAGKVAKVIEECRAIATMLGIKWRKPAAKKKTAAKKRR